MPIEQHTSPRPLHVQAHRGARNTKPENTLPAFELALDLGVDSIEMDLQLSRDGVVVVFHDDVLSPRICRSRPQLPRGPRAEIRRLTLAELRRFTADASLCRQPGQSWPATPLAKAHLEGQRLTEFAIPTLAEVFALVRSYEGDAGADAGKSPEQRSKTKAVRLDLELKGDFSAQSIGPLEDAVVAASAEADMVSRVCIRSFDHRRLQVIKRRLPALRTGVLLTGTRPVDVAALVHAAGADELYPDYRVVDEPLMRQARDAGIPVIAWTVNDEDAWWRLATWEIHGITTDYPGELIRWAMERLGRASGVA